MIKFLFMESIREWKVLIQNYLLEIIGLIIFSAIFLQTIIKTIYASNFSLSDNLLIVSIIICIVQLLNIIFSKNLVFEIHPAALHYFFNSPQLNLIKKVTFVKRIIRELALAFLLCLIIFNFKFSVDLAIATFSIFIYLTAGSFIKWFKYNKLSFIMLALLYVCTSLLFVLSLNRISLLANIPLFILSLFIIYGNNKIRIDWGKYYDDLVYMGKTNHAARHKNMPEMQQMAIDHIATAHHSLKIYALPLKRSNALLCKALIETLRMSKQVIAILGLLLVFAILLNKTMLFSEIPIIGDPNMAHVIGMLAVATFLTNLKQIYSKQIMAIVDKHKAGFFIPYPFTKIVYSYSLICFLSTVLILAVFAAILSSGWMKSIAAIIISILAMYLYFFMLAKNRANDFVNIVSNIILFLASSLFF